MMPARGKIYVKDLKVGDVVDLEGDEWADPDSSNVEYEYEYQVVCGTVNVIGGVHVVFGNGDAVTFPTNHEILIVPGGGFVAGYDFDGAATGNADGALSGVSSVAT